MKELWNKYYSEYIQSHKLDGKDLIQLTNEAINYCMEKLKLDRRMKTQWKQDSKGGKLWEQ